MNADVRSPTIRGEAFVQSDEAMAIDAFAPVHAPMAMPIQSLERSVTERLFRLPARAVLSAAGR